MPISSRDVVRSVAALLEVGRPQLDAALARSGVARPMGVILPFLSSRPTVENLPALMVQQRAEGSAPHALEDLFEDAYEMEIWGLVHWDDEGELEDAVGELAGAAKRILNARHRPVPLPDRRELYFVESTPVYRIDYGMAQLQTLTVRAFVLQWRGRVVEEVRDASGGDYA